MTRDDNLPGGVKSPREATTADWTPDAAKSPREVATADWNPDAVETVIEPAASARTAFLAGGTPLPPAARTWLEDHGELATGGMSRIRRVRHQDLRHMVAVKILDIAYG